MYSRWFFLALPIIIALTACIKEEPKYPLCVLCQLPSKYICRFYIPKN